jgi:hypothetical protein
MLFRETVAVYCENHTEHTDTFCRQNAVRTSHYDTRRKVAISRPNVVNEIFVSIYLILLAALGLGVHSASNRNEYKKKNVSGE